MAKQETNIVPFQPSTSVTVFDTKLELEKLEISAKRMDYHMKLAGAVMESGLAPRHFKNPQAVFMAIEYGVSTLGMQPMSALWNISVIQDKPSPSAASAIGACERYLDEPHVYSYFDKDNKELPQETNEVHKVVCKMKRKGIVYLGNFSLDDAKRAGLVKSGGGWEKYPKQMLEARSGMFCARKACPMIFAGIYSTEEVSAFGPQRNETSVKGTKGSENASDAILRDLETQEAIKKETEAPFKENKEISPSAMLATESSKLLSSIQEMIEKMVDKDRSQVSYDLISQVVKEHWENWKKDLVEKDLEILTGFLSLIKSSYPVEMQK